MGLLGQLARALALRSFGATISHFAVAVICAVVWVRPEALGPEVPGDLDKVLMFEFLLLHSTAFIIAFRAAKSFPLWVLGLIYAPFALGIGSTMSSPVLMIFFMWHLVSGIWGDIDISREWLGKFMVRYAGVFLLFIVVIMAFAVIDPPALGWESGRWTPRMDEGEMSDGFIPAVTTVYFAGRTVWEIVIRYADKTGELQRFIDWIQTT